MLRESLANLRAAAEEGKAGRYISVFGADLHDVLIAFDLIDMLIDSAAEHALIAGKKDGMREAARLLETQGRAGAGFAVALRKQIGD